MNILRRSCFRIARSPVLCIGCSLLLLGALSSSASFGFPGYSQRASTAFQGTSTQFEGSQVPSTQGSGGTGDPSGWSTDGSILSITNTAAVSETWFAVPGFTSNPSGGYTLEMRFKVTDPGTAYVGEFNSQGSTPGSLFAFAIKGDGVYDTLRGPNQSLFSGSLTDDFHTLRVVVAGNGDAQNGPGDHAYLYMDGNPIGTGWTSPNPYALSYNGPTRLLFGDTGGGINSGAIQIDYLRVDTTGPYAPPLEAIVVDMTGGKSFNRAILGQNGFANPYISEDREAGFEKITELFERTSIRGVAGGSSADSYNWKNRVDQFQTFVRSDGQRALGQSTLEMLRYARDNNSEMIITVNEQGIGVFDAQGTFQFTNTAAGDVASLAKDWVRYTNRILQTYRQGDVITDTEDLRILNEIGWSGPDFNTDKLLAPGEGAVPKVTYWEIGNEIDDSGTPSTYRTRYRAIVEAMRSEDPTIKVGPNVIGAASASLSSAMLNRLLRNEVGTGRERVDFISYHPYNYQTLALDGTDHDAISAALGAMKSNQLAERGWIRDRITASGRNVNDIELMTTEWNPGSWEGYSWHARQYNALGVAETAFTFAELDLRAAHFWVWPANIHTGADTPQYLALKALVDFAGDTLVRSYQEDGVRVYITRDSTNGQVVVWGMNFGYGDVDDPTKVVQLSLDDLGFEPSEITQKRLAALSGRTTLFSEVGGPNSIGWIDSDVTNETDPGNFSLVLRPAELTMLVLRREVYGDFNSDGSVDAADYVVWRDQLGTNFDLGGNGEEDGASEGIVDSADYQLWRSNFGRTSSVAGSSASVPEPSVLGILGGGLLSVGCRRRMHCKETKPKTID